MVQKITDHFLSLVFSVVSLFGVYWTGRTNYLYLHAQDAGIFSFGVCVFGICLVQLSCSGRYLIRISTMTNHKTRLLRRLALAVGLTLSASASGASGDPENTLYIQMETGRIVIEMRPDLAPNHVERIKILAREGFYDGVTIYRVS